MQISENPVTISAMKSIDPTYLNKAREMHQRCLVVDTHCDTTRRLLNPEWDFTKRDAYGHLDIPRMVEGGVGALFLAVYAPKLIEAGDGIAAARKQIACIQNTATKYHDHLALALSANDIRKAKSDKKIAILIAIEGGYLIEDSLDILREYRNAGATYMTLTHSFHTTWADSAGVHEDLEPLHGGLTDFGKDVIRELNRIGMMVDVSHASDETFWDVVETTQAPIIATHSSCRAISPHRRNLSDKMIKTIAESGGVVQINFAAAFIDSEAPPLDADVIKQWIADGGVAKKRLTDYVTPLSILVDHFDHALKLVGPEHVGIGTDFDGVPALPADMEDCSMLPNLTACLLERGHMESDLEKMLGENVLRVMDACDQMAQQ